MKASEAASARLKDLTRKPVCKLCFQDIVPQSLLTFFSSSPCLCDSCFQSLKTRLTFTKFHGYTLGYLSPYVNPLARLLIQYKQDKDVELAPVFLSYYAPLLSLLFHNYSLVPVPSSPSHLEKREFDHIRLIYSSLHLPYLELLGKKEGEEQKKLNAEERKKTSSLFYLKKKEDLSKKKILLVDDVLTSGTSLLSSLALLNTLNPKKVVFFVIMNAKVKE